MVRESVDLLVVSRFGFRGGGLGCGEECFLLGVGFCFGSWGLGVGEEGEGGEAGGDGDVEEVDLGV